MKKMDSLVQYGIYADHQKAFILTMDEDDAIACEEIKSEMIPRPRMPGESSNKIRKSGHTLNRQRKTQNREQEELKKFYSGIVDEIKYPNSILLFGPAQSKSQLLHFLQKKKKLKGVFSHYETADKLDEREAIDFFEKHVIKK